MLELIQQFENKPTIKTAVQIIGGLSNPDKMPGFSYGLPAAFCKLGSKLAKFAGTICSKCYALKGLYQFPVVKIAQMRRFNILQLALSDKYFREIYISAFVYILRHKKNMEWFRWHDSGDLQNETHLYIICEIARRCPDNLFWIPTRELQLVNRYSGIVPPNLTIRISAINIDSKPPKTDYPTSAVHDKKEAIGVGCTAYERDGYCGPCRLCWDSSIVNISYPLH